jgi:hypothetical protein
MTTPTVIDWGHLPLAGHEHGTTALAWAEYARQPGTAALLRSVTGSTR